jgi:hypothetical protein
VNGSSAFFFISPASQRLLQQQRNVLQAIRWLISFWITYPVTSCCLAVSKLLVLNRLMMFSERWTPGQPSRGTLFARIVVGFIAVGSALGLCFNVAASVFASRSYRSFDAAAARNSSQDFDQGVEERSSGQLASAFHLYFETLMLLLIVIGLTFSAIASGRRFRSVLITTEQQIAKLSTTRGGDSQSQALNTASHQQQSIRNLQYRILVTCAVLFLSFLLRAIYVTMFAVAGSLNDHSRDCPTYTNRCSDCYNIFAHINIWLLYTPEFFYAVAFLSEPVALLVALWCMTAGLTLQLMKTQFESKRQDVAMSKRIAGHPS